MFAGVLHVWLLFHAFSLFNELKCRLADLYGFVSKQCSDIADVSNKRNEHIVTVDEQTVPGHTVST